MKLWYGLFGAALMVIFLASFVIKIKEPAMIAVVLIGVVMMVIDLWHSRNESDS
jgi:membrane-bound ClpP family serine protease